MDGISSFLSESFNSLPSDPDLLFLAALITATLIVIGCAEPVFDYLNMYWIASKIRKVKGFFMLKKSLDAQTEWVEYMDSATAWRYENLQWREYIISRILFLVQYPEYTNEANLGCWRKRLDHSEKNIDYIQQTVYQHHLKKPKGPRVRQYEVSARQRAKLLEQNPVKFLSQQHRVKDCRLSGGCCGRGCGCCLMPRAIRPNGDLFYSHCTAKCGCCILSRGSVDEVTDAKGRSCPVQGAKVLD